MADRCGRTTTMGLALMIAAAAPPGHAAGAPWLPWRDANPFVAASGLPLAPPAFGGEGWQVELIAGASNSELAFDRGSEHLVYDTEIHEARLAVTRSFGAHWLARASLGTVSFGSGFLDGFLQDWHRLLGLSNGDRGRLGTGGHVIDYRDGSDLVRLDRSLRATTPLLVDVAWRAPLAADSQWLAGMTLKLPTTHASVLVDDRAVDASVWMSAQSLQGERRLGWGVRLGALHRGDGELLPARANTLVPFADAAVGWQFTPQWDASAQLQWHGAPYDSRISFLREATTLALSTGWRTHAGWTLRAGLVEDVQALHAQDVTLFVSVAR